MWKHHRGGLLEVGLATSRHQSVCVMAIGKAVAFWHHRSLILGTLGCFEMDHAVLQISVGQLVPSYPYFEMLDVADWVILLFTNRFAFIAYHHLVGCGYDEPTKTLPQMFKLKNFTRASCDWTSSHIFLHGGLEAIERLNSNPAQLDCTSWDRCH